MDKPARMKARLKCYDERGRHLYNGTVRRWVVLEGLEDVRIGQLEYAGCLRLQVATTFNLHWGPTIDLVQYLWLARGIGEVRRIERVTGWVLLLPFSATETYDLIDYVPSATGATQPGWLTREFPRWACMAVEFLETLPHPRMGGMRIELTQHVDTADAARPSRQAR